MDFMPLSAHADDERCYVRMSTGLFRRQACSPPHCSGRSCRHCPSTASDRLFARTAVPDADCRTLDRVLLNSMVKRRYKQRKEMLALPQNVQV